MKKCKVLLIIPAYNEEANILRLYQTILAYQKTCDAFELDYIVINDGSTDSTRQICDANHIKTIHLIQNLGIGGAVQTGYIYAKNKGYDIAVQFDGDGQHDIQSLEALVRPIMQGKADFVVGSRFLDQASEFQSTALRRIGIHYLSFILLLCSRKRIYDVTSGYRAANKRVIAHFAKRYPVDYPEPESLMDISKQNFRVSEVSVNMFERSGGESSITGLKSLYYMIKVSLAIICTAFQRG